MKKIIPILLIFACVFGLCSCSVKEQEALITEVVSVSNPAIRKNDDDALLSEKFNDVTFAKKEEYTYKNNSYSLSSPYFDENALAANVQAYFDITVNSVGSDKDGYIRYIAYDANGEEVRNSYIVIDIEGHSAGDILKGYLIDFPYEAVRVEFVDYK